MATTVNFMQPDLQLDQDQIARNRQIADMLRQQSQTPMQGQMVGQIYVPPSWTQGLAKLVQGYQSGQMNKQADTDSRALAAQLMQRNQSDAQNFMNAVQGSTPEQQGNNPSAYTPAQQGSPDFQKAISIGMQNPMLMPMAQKLMEQRMVPKVPKWEKVEKPNPDGSTTLGYVDANSPNPWATFQPGGTGPVKGIAVNGQIVNPFQMGQTIPKQAEAPNPGTNLVIPGPGGEMVPNKPLIEARKAIAKSGATNVNVDTAQKPFLNAVGKEMGEELVSDFRGAKSAQATLANARQIESALPKVISGPGAGVRVKLSQIGEMIGVNGADETEKLQNTRSLIQGLARQELAAAGSMKGQGQITDNERALLQRAEAGTIQDLTIPEIRTLVGALKKTANYRINTHNTNMERASKDPNMRGMVEYMTLPQGQPQGGSVLDQADAILRGK
jgi:hypothetical protein